MSSRWGSKLLNIAFCRLDEQGIMYRRRRRTLWETTMCYDDILRTRVRAAVFVWLPSTVFCSWVHQMHWRFLLALVFSPVCFHTTNEPCQGSFGSKPRLTFSSGPEFASFRKRTLARLKRTKQLICESDLRFFLATFSYILTGTAMASSSNPPLLQDDGLWTFLRKRGIPEENIQKMQQDRVSDTSQHIHSCTIMYYYYFIILPQVHCFIFPWISVDLQVELFIWALLHLVPVVNFLFYFLMSLPPPPNNAS